MQKRYLGDGAVSFPGEHLGLGYLQAHCAQQGLSVSTLNGQALGHTSIAQTWDAMRQLATDKGVPLLVGFTATAEYLDEALHLAEQVKTAWTGTFTALGHDFASLN